MQGVALPGGVQYVPMIFSASYATPAIIALAKLSGSDALLGFNEPNEKVQAANTVQLSLLPCRRKKQLRQLCRTLPDCRKCIFTMVTTIIPSVATECAKLLSVIPGNDSIYKPGGHSLMCHA